MSRGLRKRLIETLWAQMNEMKINDRALRLWPLDQQRSAATMVFETAELRESILAHLPLEAMYRAMRVSKNWRLSIAYHPQMQQQRFKKPGEEGQLTSFRVIDEPFNIVRLQAAPITINPLINRTFVISTKEGEVTGYTSLDAPRCPVHPNPTITENILDWRPTNCVERHPPRELIDEDQRPILYYTEETPPDGPFLEPCSIARPGKKEGQVEWKSIFFCQPPVRQLVLVHPSRRADYLLRSKHGVTMGHVAMCLELCFEVDDWPENGGRTHASRDIKLVMPLFDKNGKEAMDGPFRLCRALKTKLRCRFKSADEDIRVATRVMEMTKPQRKKLCGRSNPTE